ncbi:hypothetical protein B9Z55_006953 [Caenorhabditis nigoni]|uniref:Uncharacterized protein n=1 Tax=Caenorhabditis nigoni TaxID=1611254 RepID=A0A2G5V836_9PELO|nr:hypothetical protein B9Z55_006953 [Caenorhabditis nigoni]
MIFTYFPKEFLKSRDRAKEIKRSKVFSFFEILHKELLNAVVVIKLDSFFQGSPELRFLSLLFNGSSFDDFRRKKIFGKVMDRTMKDVVLKNKDLSKIEEKRQEAKLQRSLEETVEFYDNNRIEELLMAYFEERENWNMVPDESQNYLAPIMTMLHVPVA